MPLWDPRFKYVPSAKTDVAETWRRFGFRPTTENERRKRQRAEPTAKSLELVSKNAPARRRAPNTGAI